MEDDKLEAIIRSVWEEYIDNPEVTFTPGGFFRWLNVNQPGLHRFVTYAYVARLMATWTLFRVQAEIAPSE